jgi:thiol-disulfide isomerase/thioredoxin
MSALGQIPAPKQIWANFLVVRKSTGPHGPHTDTLRLADMATGQDKHSFFIDHRGDTINYRAFSGKVVLLDFWFLACRPCLAELPGMDALQAGFPRASVQVIAFANDPMPALEAALLSKRNFAMRIVSDVYIPNGMYPTKVLLDRRGGIVDYQTGGSMTSEAVQRILNKYRPLIIDLL